MLVGGVIVPPEENEKKREDSRKQNGIYLHRKGRHRGRAYHNVIHVSDERPDRENS